MFNIHVLIPNVFPFFISNVSNKVYIFNREFLEGLLWVSMVVMVVVVDDSVAIITITSSMLIIM